MGLFISITHGLSGWCHTPLFNQVTSYSYRAGKRGQNDVRALAVTQNCNFIEKKLYISGFFSSFPKILNFWTDRNGYSDMKKICFGRIPRLKKIWSPLILDICKGILLKIRRVLMAVTWHSLTSPRLKSHIIVHQKTNEDTSSIKV